MNMAAPLADDLPEDIDDLLSFINSIVEGGHYNLLKYTERSVYFDTDRQWDIAEKLAKKGHTLASAKWIGEHNLNLADLTSQHKALLDPAAIRTLLVFMLQEQPNDDVKKAIVASFMAHKLLPQEGKVNSIISVCNEIDSIMRNESLDVTQAMYQASFHRAKQFLAVNCEEGSYNSGSKEEGIGRIPEELKNLIVSYVSHIILPGVDVEPLSGGVSSEEVYRMRQGLSIFFPRNNADNKKEDSIQTATDKTIAAP
jgi:hypothetical protein